MCKYVFRTDPQLRPVGDPLSCIDAVELFFRPGMPTVQECVQQLVAHDEISLGMSDKRPIMRGARLVGYIRIVDDCHEAHRAAPRSKADAE